MASIAGDTIEPRRAIPGAVTRSAAARLMSVDALRGFVMVVMLLDHVRETWLLYIPLGDPVDALTVMPSSFFSRISSTLCAPIFVALTGLGAYLYSQKHSLAETSSFLLKRGLFLVVLELTLVNFSWRAEIVPQFVFLQVIWAIGWVMVILAGLIHLPQRSVFVIGLLIVGMHNLLDPIVFPPESPMFVPWAIIHQRSALELGGLTIKFNYPLLPWIGVIALGWSIGPWFTGLAGDERRRRLVLLGAAMIVGFLVLRALNVYGDKPWFSVPDQPVRTVMSFLALTKYPPSLLFLLPTLGIGALLLAGFERMEGGRISHWLSVLGGAPMFFYLLHLYVLRVLYVIALAIWGPNHGLVFGVSSIAWVWVWWLALIVPLYFPTRWYSNLKKRRKDIWWLKYL